MGIYDPDPGFLPADIGEPIENDSVQDFNGDGADPLPVGETDLEPDDDTPPDRSEYWQIAEVDNQEPTKERTGFAVFYDLDVTDEGTYEYYALAKIVDDVSPESNHSVVGFDGDVKTQGIVAMVRAGQKWVEVVVSLPPVKVVW
jgi:hypothetical protein